jgi:lysophospholipase L1-like esterase
MSTSQRTTAAAVVAMLLVCLGLSSCSSPPQLPLLAEDAVVLAFGDSLTYGTGAAPGESYPEVLARLINRRVVSLGVPGEVSAEGLLRLPEVIERVQPALLLFCHGGNDQLRRLEPRQTEANLRAMIQAARDRGVAVALIAVPAPGLTLAPPPFYQEMARELALPLEADIVADILADGSLKSDYIHPNTEGYRRLAEAVASLLRRSGAIP